MAEFPALPLWTDAYLGDTTHLTTIEHGAYFLLLLVAWRSRDTALPDDDRLLARYTRTTASQWRRLRPVLAEFFEIADGIWRQRRLMDEATAVRRHREAMAQNGRASALKRKERHSTKRQPSDDKASTPIPNSTLAKAKGADAPVFDPKKALFDEGVPLLTAGGERTEIAARKMLGKWLKARGPDGALALVRAAADVDEPVSWIEARIRRVTTDEDERTSHRRATLAWYAEQDAKLEQQH